MTSTFVLDNIHKQKNLWTYSLPGSPLGGLEDRYLKVQGKCHPDFVSVPIGHPNGMKMCLRKPGNCGGEIGDSLHAEAKRNIDESQGYWRGSVNLYDTKQRLPTQQINPEHYSSRRTPWEGDLVREDYIHHQMRYSGTGINPVRTPHQLMDKNHPYFENDFSFTPREDPITGKRIATSLDESLPPPKYDVTQLHQRYPVWKRESEYVGKNWDQMDTQYMTRIV